MLGVHVDVLKSRTGSFTVNSKETWVGEEDGLEYPGLLLGEGVADEA